MSENMNRNNNERPVNNRVGGANNGGGGGTVAAPSSMISILQLFNNVLRLLLWPVIRLQSVIFPTNELDGLSPAVTAKAAEQFCQLLLRQQQQQQSSSTITNNSDSSNNNSNDNNFWQPLGFTALQQQATEEHKLILLYLHSPLHASASACLQQLVSHAADLDALQDSVLGLGLSVHSGIGWQLQRQMNVTALPALAVLQPARRRPQLQLLVQVQGARNLLSTPWIPLVQAAVQRHQIHRQEQLAAELQLQEDRALRQQMDAEYQAALAADQERERQVHAAKEAEERAQQEAEEREAVKARALQDARDQIPDIEPSGNEATAIRLVLPSGQRVQRKFRRDDTIATVRAYLHVYIVDHVHAKQTKTDKTATLMSATNLGLSTNFPKQTYEQDDMTLQEAGLVPQAVLMVQDLDA